MSNNWFGIDSTGWRRMNAGRKMGHLVREGISNVLDLDDVTTANIAIEPGHVIIEDDGSVGFEDPDLVFTVFMTGKEDSHLKRGRKGRGLKELIAAADKATVETKGYTIFFGENGRTQEKNSRTKGTKVEIWSSLENWLEKGAEEALEYLRRIIPPEIVFTINGQRITAPIIKKKFDASLQTTVIKDEVEKTVYQKTSVTIYALRKGEKQGWVYEMGIPVQETKAPFNVDVGQRIPMNDNRDTINQYWITWLHALILDTLIDTMDKKDLRADWVLECAHLANHRTDQQYVAKMVGKNAAIKSGNRKADDIAKQHGYEIVDLSILPKGAAEVIERFVQNTAEIAKEIQASRRDQEVIADTEQQKFQHIVQWFGRKLLGKTIQCRFFAREPDFTGYITQAEYGNDTIGFNILGGNDFSKPLSPDIISTMVHEFAHDLTPEHDEKFQAEVERLSGQMAYTILHHYDEIREKFGRLSYMPGKTTVITCVDCGAEREVKVQDAFQVKRCRPCQKKKR